MTLRHGLAPRSTWQEIFSIASCLCSGAGATSVPPRGTRKASQSANHQFEQQGPREINVGDRLQCVSRSAVTTDFRACSDVVHVRKEHERDNAAYDPESSPTNSDAAGALGRCTSQGTLCRWAQWANYWVVVQVGFVCKHQKAGFQLMLPMESSFGYKMSRGPHITYSKSVQPVQWQRQKSSLSSPR